MWRDTKTSTFAVRVLATRKGLGDGERTGNSSNVHVHTQTFSKSNRLGNRFVMWCIEKHHTAITTNFQYRVDPFPNSTVVFLSSEGLRANAAWRQAQHCITVILLQQAFKLWYTSFYVWGMLQHSPQQYSLLVLWQIGMDVRGTTDWLVPSPSRNLYTETWGRKALYSEANKLASMYQGSKNLLDARFIPTSHSTPGFMLFFTALFAFNTASYTSFWFGVNFPFAGKLVVMSELYP